MIERKSKRGTHVGIIISFVIFVTFIVFLYVAIQPKIGTTSKKNLLESVKSKVIDQASTNLTTTSVLVDKTNHESCVKLVGFFTGTGMDSKIKASNQAGVGISGMSKEGSDLYLPRNTDEFLFNVYESDDFSPISTGILSGCSGATYNLGLIKTSNSILESRVKSMISNYTEDYSQLSSLLGVTGNNGFGFGLTYDNGTTIGTRASNVSISVFSDDTLIRYVNRNGVEESGLLTVKVW